jgi:uncharacterized protein (DUF4415 family)
MQTRKPGIENEWVDRDDAPRLTREWFERADLYRGDKMVRRGRPNPLARRRPSTCGWTRTCWRIFRKTGPGWQSRINEALRL